MGLEVGAPFRVNGGEVESPGMYPVFFRSTWSVDRGSILSKGERDSRRAPQ